MDEDLSHVVVVPQDQSDKKNQIPQPSPRTKSLLSLLLLVGALPVIVLGTQYQQNLQKKAAAPETYTCSDTYPCPTPTPVCPDTNACPSPSSTPTPTCTPLRPCLYSLGRRCLMPIPWPPPPGGYCPAPTVTPTPTPTPTPNPAYGQALKFPNELGNNSFLLTKETSKLLLGAKPYTIEFWVNLPKPEPGSTYIRDYSVVTLTNLPTITSYGYIYRFSLEQDQQAGTYIVHMSTLSNSLIADPGQNYFGVWGSTPNLIPGNWNHIAVTGYSAGQFCYQTLFINGLEANSTSRAGDNCQISGTNLQHLYIGRPDDRAGGNSNYYFPGILDDLRISNVVRYKETFLPPGPHLADPFTLALWNFNNNYQDQSLEPLIIEDQVFKRLSMQATGPFTFMPSVNFPTSTPSPIPTPTPLVWTISTNAVCKIGNVGPVNTRSFSILWPPAPPALASGPLDTTYDPSQKDPDNNPLWSYGFSHIQKISSSYSSNNMYFGLQTDVIDPLTKEFLAFKPISVSSNSSQIDLAKYFNPQTWMAHWYRTLPVGDYTITFEVPPQFCVPSTPTPPPATPTPFPQTPTPSPTPVPGCNSTCLVGIPTCSQGMGCYTQGFVPLGQCRNNSCPANPDCACPTPTPTPQIATPAPPAYHSECSLDKRCLRVIGTPSPGTIPCRFDLDCTGYTQTPTPIVVTPPPYHTGCTTENLCVQLTGPGPITCQPGTLCLPQPTPPPPQLMTPSPSPSPTPPLAITRSIQTLFTEFLRFLGIKI